MTDVLPTRVLASAPPRTKVERLVFVTDHDEAIRVRWHLGRPDPWKCDQCGSQTTADCAHTFAAGMALAEELLGLVRVPQLNERTPHV